MALTMATSFRGIDIPAAYVRVASFYGNKSSVEVCVTVAAMRDAPALESRNYVLSYDIDGDNPIRQAYLHLKSLPEFSGAVDC
jgi:hypothetical protein